MLQTDFQAYECINSKGEDFLIFFYVFLCFKHRSPIGLSYFEPVDFIWTNLVKDYNAVLYTKFQAPELSGSEGEDFWIISIYFSDPGCPGAGHFGPGSHHLNKLGISKCYLPKFRNLNLAIMEKKIFK